MPHRRDTHDQRNLYEAIKEERVVRFAEIPGILIERIIQHLEGEEMEPFVNIKNVGRGEAISRSVVGIILIASAFFISGGFRWVLGLIGVALILTTIFGY